jgi:hypothetical protein
MNVSLSTGCHANHTPDCGFWLKANTIDRCNDASFCAIPGQQQLYGLGDDFDANPA